MTAMRDAVPGPGMLICLAVLMVGFAGCDNTDAPAWDNPLDPAGSAYVMQFPVMGYLAANANRQVTVTVFSVDPYASLILIERKNGSQGVYVQVGSAPATQQIFVDNVPLSEGPVLWYRVRLQGVGGALSPYSVAQYVALP